jgi:hypothetical protein
MPLPPHSQALHDKAEEQRRLCRDWLISLMSKSRQKPATKEALRNEAIRRWGVSKSAFDFGWISAIEHTGCQHWYEPSPRGEEQSKKTGH